MLSRSQSPTDTPAKLLLVGYPDPLVERLGHRPGSPYVELVWLGVLGPSTTLAWQRLARQVTIAGPGMVDVADLSLSLGLGDNLGRNATVSRTLARLTAFGAGRRCGDTLAVRLALPDVPQRSLARLSASALAAHARFGCGPSADAHATAAGPAVEPGMAVGL